MRTDSTHIEFIAWDDSGAVGYFPSAESLIRWAQERSAVAVDSYRVLHDSRAVVAQRFEREGDRWVARDGSGRLVANIAAEASDDPLVLDILNWVDASELAEAVTPLRVPPHEWDTGVGRYERAGISMPEARELGWVWRYCPEVLADRLRPLPRGQRELVLATIDTHITLVRLHANMAPEEVEELVHAQSPGRVREIVAAVYD